MRKHSLSLFPCYYCNSMGPDVPRCDQWRKCKKYRKWLAGNGIKGLAIYLAGIIKERMNSND